MSDKNKRKYAYEKAIEAYWHHVDRYHTWMNYYALFNGALFVGYCTLLTATTYIQANDILSVSTAFCLGNNYKEIQFFLSVIGLMTGICWLCSIKGHELWEKNWMNIIENYEDYSNRVYTLLITDKGDITNSDSLSDNSLLTDKNSFSYSTHKLTKFFVCLINIGWIICIIYQCSITLSFCFIILISVAAYIVLISFCMHGIDISSNVKGKYWKEKKYP